MVWSIISQTFSYGLTTVFKTLLPIIIAGLMNGSFVIPSQYIRNLNDDEIWLGHCIIGLIIIPCVILSMISPESIKVYSLLPAKTIIIILLSGIVFGVGQICFMKAIREIGIGASFSVNLGIGTAIGSLFVVLYRGVFFSASGLFVILSVLLTIAGLILYYLGSKPMQIDSLNLNAQIKKSQLKIDHTSSDESMSLKPVIDWSKVSESALVEVLAAKIER